MMMKEMIKASSSVTLILTCQIQTAMATSAINLHDSKKALVAAISANPQSFQKKQAYL